MFRGIGFGAERFGLAALKFPKSATACLLALVVLIGVSLPKVSFDDDIHRVFLSDSPLSQAQRAYEQEQSPPLSPVLIYITSPTPLDAAEMTALRELSLDLEFVKGVSAVASPFVLRWPPDTGAPSGRPLFGPQINADFGEDISAFEDLKTGLPTLLNGARTAMLLGLSIDTDQTSLGDAVKDISAELDGALPSDMSARITGEDVISTEIVAGLKTDLVALNLWGALIILLAAYVLLRDLAMALLAVGPALIGAAGVLALSAWLGYPITVLSNVIPILLLVLGVADGVHLVVHLKDSRSIRDTVETVGPACALTALTTAVAFASITVTGNAQLFEFAILGALGTLLSFVIILVTFALLGCWIRLSDRQVPQFTASIAQRLVTTAVARPRHTVVICLVLLIVSTVGFTQTTAWFPLFRNLPDHSKTLATNDAIAKDFGGVFQMIVETRGSWDQTRAVVDRLEAMSGPQAVLSELNLARWLGDPDVRPTNEQLQVLPQALVARLRSGEDTSRIFVSVPEPMRSPKTLAQFDALSAAAYAAGADRIIGLPMIMRQEAVTLIHQLSRGLVVAALGATVLVALAFRSARLAPLLMLPNILPLMLTGASLHLWARGELSPTAVLALTIAFGIAIDDTVHFLARFFSAKAQGDRPAQAVRAATRSAGQVMVLTTLLLTTGLCVTLFSDFSPIRLFGGMMIVTLWAALLSDLLLLPALLTRKETPNASV